MVIRKYGYSKYFFICNELMFIVNLFFLIEI